MLAGSCPVIKYYAITTFGVKENQKCFVQTPLCQLSSCVPYWCISIYRCPARWKKRKSPRCIWRWTLSNPISVVFYWRDISVTKGKLWIFCKSTITMDSPVCQGTHLTERNEKIMYYSWRSTQLCAAVRSEWTHPNPKVLATPESGPSQIHFSYTVSLLVRGFASSVWIANEYLWSNISIVTGNYQKFVKAIAMN